jgi:hypothetical protein
MSQAGIINVQSVPAVPTTFVTDSGTAIPALNILNVVTPGSGTQGISTSASGNTVTITLSEPKLSGTGTTAGAVTSNIIILPLGAVPGVYTFDAQISGFDPTNDIGVGYTLVGAVRTSGAAAVLISGQDLDQFEEAGMEDADAAISVSGNTAIFSVTGVAGHNMDWKVVSEYVFVS